MSRPQEYIEGEAPASQQCSVSPGGSKVTAERVALLVLSALLTAAVFVICRLSFDNVQSFQTLRDEHEALQRDLTETLSEIKSYKLPHPFQGNVAEPRLTCDEGWEQHGGKCYYFSTSKSSWSWSRNECRFQGGDLVQIDSIEEQIFLELKLREKMKNPNDKFWIGLTDSKKEGTWLWVDGLPLNTSLTFWSSRQPDDQTKEDPDGEDCVRMGAYYPKGWFDRACKVPYRRICEKQTMK